MITKVFAVSKELKDIAPNPNLDSFGLLISAIVRNAFILAGLISFFLLIFGGFQVIVAGGDPKKMQQGKGAITGAVTGLLVVFGSFWIVQIIHVLTGIDILSPAI